VVLPGESQDAFDADLQTLLDEWKPPTLTRATLVERFAVAAWKLRRATRSEAARLHEPAADAAHDHDLSRKQLVEGAPFGLTQNPVHTLLRLEFGPTGLDLLIGMWDSLARAAAEPGGWTSRTEHHDRLLNLLGHPSGSDPKDKDLEVARASTALLGGHDPGAAAAVGAVCAARAAEMRRERAKFSEPGFYRQRSIDFACAPVTKEAQLMHRYEMAHEKSLYAALRALMALDRSGADLAEEPEAIPEAVAEPVAAPAGPDAPEKQDTTPDVSSTSDELASVGAQAPSGGRPGRPEAPAGSPGGPGGPAGADRGPKKPPRRS
jgi:hypothetical protein